MAGKLCSSDLRQFTGDLVRYRHAINRHVIYTPGVQFVAEQGAAYWLIDEIALALASNAVRTAVARDPRVGQLHFWHLAVAVDHSACLTARADRGVAPFVTRRIPCTDFPLPEIDVWAARCEGEWTLYLPSEH